mgnify:CR=1 FL=1
MSTINVAADALRLFVERIERLEEEKKGIAGDIKDVYGEAKSSGYDVKTLRAIVRLRKMEIHVRQEAEALLETYKAALGMDDLFSGHDGRAARDDAAAGNWATNLADLDAKGIGVSIAVGSKAAVPLNDAARAEDAEFYARAMTLVVEAQKATASWLQRQLRIGYNSAARLIERMEADSIVSAPDHVGKRRVLCTSEELGLAAGLAAMGVNPPLNRQAIAEMTDGDAAGAVH